MARTDETLEERIEAWPEQLREAMGRYTRAKMVVTGLDQRLEHARIEARRRQEEDEPESVDDEPPSRLLELEHRVQQAALELEQAKAEADVEARASGPKLTDTAVSARVRSAPQVLACQRALLSAQHERDRAKLHHDQEMRAARERRRAAADSQATTEFDAVVGLLAQLAKAEAELDEARMELSYLRAVGRALQMRVDLLRADAGVIAAPVRRAQ